MDATSLAADHLSRYDALLRISKTLARHKTIAELFEALADELHAIVPFDYLGLVLHDEPTRSMRLVVLEPSDLVPPFVSKPVADHGPAATVWETQQGTVIAIPEEGELQPALEFIRSHGRKMTCWLPLTTAHRRVGVLIFGSRSSAAYTDDILAFMEQVAATVAIAVDNGINYDEAQRYQRALRDERDNLRFLLEVNNLLASHLDSPALLKAISEAVQRVVKHDHISIALHDAETGLLELHWTYDDARGLARSDVKVPLDRSAAGIAFQKGTAIAFRRPDLEQLGPDSAPMMKATGLESVCCVPLVTRKGKLGTLNVGSASPDAFSQEDVALLGQTSAQIAIAVENARSYEAMAALNAQLTDEKQYFERELQQEFSEIVGTSSALGRVLTAVRTVAPTDSTVLLLGETGTGKELIARAIHDLSPRRDRTFVRMSVAALPPGLLESELFGHEKGAFTGATTSRTGRLELAHRGTLFLDEVGDIPMEVQPKLLRVLQEREFERLGSTRTQRVDVRIVAATNRDLAQMVEAGSFRSDLYYRLNVFPVGIPPLRDRVADIPALAEHFARQCAKRMGRPVPSISDGVMDALKGWTWPGNIRELQNFIERAIIVSTGPNLVLPLHDVQPKARHAGATSKSMTLEDAEREAILRALRESNGVVAGPAGAAARLGLPRTTLHSKMRRLGIQRQSY
ncbi:MAG TPA: sigma 54-interacting transcriptional regulator [Vicinamibacterales bacterium]|nr:sigma 54-interacting transcriptional regulator [Vicinamibacterales bacterium]